MNCNGSILQLNWNSKSDIVHEPIIVPFPCLTMINGVLWFYIFIYIYQGLIPSQIKSAFQKLLRSTPKIARKCCWCIFLYLSFSVTQHTNSNHQKVFVVLWFVYQGPFDLVKSNLHRIAEIADRHSKGRLVQYDVMCDIRSLWQDAQDVLGIRLKLYKTLVLSSSNLKINQKYTRDLVALVFV